MAENDVDNELLDYEEDEEPQGAPESATPAGKKEVKGSYVSIHSSGFRDFLLKPELLRAIIDCGFEHPSEGELHFMCWYWLRLGFSKIKCIFILLYFLNHVIWITCTHFRVKK